jgi:hypothetical protein
VAFCLVTAVALGFFVRYELWLQWGGLETDYVRWANTHYFGGIAGWYVVVAQHMRAGHWDAFGSVYPPGYPLWLVALQSLGLSVQEIRLVQALIDACASALAYDVAMKLGCGRVASVVVAFLYALSPWWAQGSQFIMGEALIPAGVLAVLAIACRVIGSTRPAAWFAFGVAGASLTWLRADMQLLGGPLALFAGFSAGPRMRDRLRAAAAAAAGAAAVLFAWALSNYAMHGQFTIGNRAAYYAIWSGLGQVQNDYGYVLSDDNAIKVLAERGLRQHTLESEAYWRQEYLKAWRDHPEHVMATIRRRWFLVTKGPEEDFTSRLTLLVHYGPLLLAGALIVTLTRRAVPVALLVLGPVAYALLSLGFVYVETRYVRYASLTYLLAFGVVLGAILAWAGRRRLLVRSLIFAAVAAFLGREGFYAAREVGALNARGQMETISYAARLLPEPAWPSEEVQCAPDWSAQAQGAGVVESPPGTFRIRTEGTGPAPVQVTARLVRTRGMAARIRGRGAAMVVRARAVSQGPAQIALARRDTGLSLDYATLPPAQGVAVRLAGVLEGASPGLVVTATAPTESPGVIEVSDVRCRYLCYAPGETPRRRFVFNQSDLLRAYPLRDCAASDPW